MYLKYILCILLGTLYFSQNIYANGGSDNIPLGQFKFPKYDDIAHSPIEVEYQGQKGTVLFISEKLDDKQAGNLKIYFLTKNNQELNKAFEISSLEYSELVAAFIYKEKKSGYKSVFILTKNHEDLEVRYRYWELPLIIDDDGVLRVLFFSGDDALLSRKVCIDNVEKHCEYSTQEGLEHYLDIERNK